MSGSQLSRAATKKDRDAQADSSGSNVGVFPEAERQPTQNARGGYQSAFPVRSGRVITLLNVPEDLTTNEAERFALFVRMLGVE
jgi:hypothetical protein